MATTNSQPESSISRAHTVVCGNSDSSSSSNLTRTRTVFYSLDTNDTAEDNKKKRSQFETSKDDEDTAEMDDTIELKYKQPKISHDTEQDITEPVTPVTSSPIISSQPLQPQRGQQAESSAVKTTKESDIPDWHNNYTAWAYLQSQNPEYESRYLVKRDNMEEGRSGYVLGRKSDCDIV
jgi:FtsZ-interacting cell division protein ZipA